MNEREESIREYAQSDRQEIIKLHNEVFQSNLNVSRWEWQFENNPKGHSWIILAQSGSEIVGQYNILRHNINLNGQEIIAGQSCDTMVRLDQRGKGWFVKLAIADYEIAKQNGGQVVFGFPNRNSYPGFMKHLGWDRLFRLNYYSYRLGFEKIVGRHADIFFRNTIRLKHYVERKINQVNLKKDCVFATKETLPLNMDDFFIEINAFEVLSVWKDCEYLKWRYEKHPHNKYLFHLLMVEGEYECLIITRTGVNVTICEVLSRTKNLKYTLLALYEVMLCSIKTRAQIIDFHGYDDGFFNALFTRAKFNKGLSGFVFCGKVFQENKLKVMFNFPNNWTISVGDTDVI